MQHSDLSMKEFKTAFDALKNNKASGFDDINPNIIKTSYQQLMLPFFHICKQSLKWGIFPQNMKIAKITPLFKSGETDLVNNYRPISILPVFSKVLERIMYNRLYAHVTICNNMHMLAGCSRVHL